MTTGRSSTAHAASAFAGLAIVIAVAVLWYELQGNPQLHVSRGRDPGPAFQPQALLVLLGACAAWMIVSSFLQGLGRIRMDDLRSAAATTARQMSVPLVMVATLISFVLLAPVFGFLPVSLAFTVGWALWLAWRAGAEHRPRRLVTALLGAVAVTLGVFYIFARVIGVPL